MSSILSDVEFGLCLYEYLVFHLSWCEVTMVRIDAMVWVRFGIVETVGIRQEIWFVMLKSAKDRIVGVDTPGQYVPPRVWYGMACWLIRKALATLSCWMSGIGMAIPMRLQGAGEAWGYSVVPNTGNLSNCERELRVFFCTQQGETYGKTRHAI
jgi:hypothetical protein